MPQDTAPVQLPLILVVEHIPEEITLTTAEPRSFIPAPAVRTKTLPDNPLATPTCSARQTEIKTNLNSVSLFD